MIDVGQKATEPLALGRLEDVLAEFIIVNPPRNNDTAQHIEDAERVIRAGLNKAGESGTAVMGTASALLSLIRSYRRNASKAA